MLLGAGAIVLFVSAGAVFWHFQVGGDIAWLKIKNRESAQYWGQIGDFFGGVLNPLLSFLALVAVSLSLRSQTAELKAARYEASTSQNIQNLQTKVYERQSFESVFFGLLQMHSTNLQEMRRSASGASGRAFFNERANQYSAWASIRSGRHLDDQSAVSFLSSSFIEHDGESMAHYFRTLSELLDYVDSFGKIEIARTPFLVQLTNVKQSPEGKMRDRYARIVRSVLSSGELHLIFLYCIAPEGVALKRMVEKYALLENYDVSHVVPVEVKAQFMSMTAFGNEEG